MTTRSADLLVPVTLVVGPEGFLAERAVSAVVQAAKAADADADVSEVAGADLSPAGLAEQLSPSLFATRRVLVVRNVHDVSKPVAEALLAHLRTGAEDSHLVLVHPGGAKSKLVVDTLRKAGAREITVEKLTRAEDQVAFVRAEVRRSRGHIDEYAARRLVEAVGGDLRALASAASQLASDAPDGVIDGGVVALYFEGRAEVKGWVVADRAVEGRTAEAIEQLRWALGTGTEPVMVTGSLATALRALVRLDGVTRGARDVDVARDIGVPSWKVRVLRAQLRGWTTVGLSRAIRAVAAADLAVKGGANDAALALTKALVEIGQAREAH